MTAALAPVRTRTSGTVVVLHAHPDDSVCDADHRIWGVPNVFVTDGSALPTQGAANPALTIMALASRLAERMACGAAMDDDPAARAGRASG